MEIRRTLNIVNFFAFALGVLFSTQAYSWTKTFDFNEGNIGDKVSGMEAQGNTIYDSERVLEGTQAAKLTSTQGKTGYGSWGGVIPHDENLYKGDEIWFRVNTYFPSGFDYHATGEGLRLKFLRFHTLSAEGNNYGYNDIYIDREGSGRAFLYIYEGEAVWKEVADDSYLPKFDVWETYEFYVKFDSKSKDDGGDAVIRFWKDGVLLKEITDRKTLKDDAAYSPRTLLFTYWNGGAPQTQSMWVDDIVLTTEQPASLDSEGNPYIGKSSIDSESSPVAPPNFSVNR